MPYLGTPPQSGFISQEANQYFTGLTQNYIDLNQSISSLSSVIVLVNGVVQENSTMSLTSSTRITLGDTLVSADKVTCIYVAKISSTQAPATGSVTSDMLSGSIANSKLANSSVSINGSSVSLGGSVSVSGTWVLLQTTTLSSTTANVDFDNLFDSTYKNYVVLGSEIKGDVDNKILCRFGTGSTPTYDSTSNYRRVVSYVTSAGSDAIKHSTTDTAVLVTPNTTDISDGDMSFRMVFPEPQNTSRRLQVYFEGTQNDGHMTYFAGTGRCDNIAHETPVTSVRFTPNTGSGFASGTFKLYGVK
jgi:lipopolysaccharide export system protein LptA